MLCFVALVNCGGKKNSSSIADNTQFNTKYKTQERVSPIANIVARRQDASLLEKNYAYYNRLHEKEVERFRENRDYIRFVTQHNIKKIKNVTVETLPLDNAHYIELQAEKDAVVELNKMPQHEIEYVMFINEALIEKHERELAGDPIEHPFVYEKSIGNGRQVVMGDEYRHFSSWCEVNGRC